MRFLSHKRRKYLLMAPLIFLLLNALFFKYATQEIQDNLLRQKYFEIVHAVNMLSAAVEANPERVWIDHEHNIRDSMEYLDKLYQIYAGAYKPSDNGLMLITQRYYETSPFEPMEFEVLTQAIQSNESGSLVIGYTPENQTYRELHIYFRWIPLYSSPHERYLVVAGVSQYSVETTVALWVSIGQWVSMGITYVVLTFMIIVLSRLGQIHEQRNNSKRRSERWR